ncbi:hypothetical protein K7X08_012674 [Anisodus acutangulus]|uniref:Uncharacterized protein n=1 Tax=Anisodus acutangulus TaxID=402998 RepID=A0A9Q1M9K0_9SOLA|nr:hypothetical protein K7X08_012674 [Anisodus acutangulus]
MLGSFLFVYVSIALVWMARSCLSTLDGPDLFVLCWAQIVHKPADFSYVQGPNDQKPNYLFSYSGPMCMRHQGLHRIDPFLRLKIASSLIFNYSSSNCDFDFNISTIFHLNIEGEVKESMIHVNPTPTSTTAKTRGERNESLLS